jgi:esterase/lipase superfamily enzyme
MLIFTNRQLVTTATNAQAFSDVFTPFLDTLNCADVQPSGTGWKVSQPTVKLSNEAALKKIDAVLGGDKPVLVYLHGNNTTPEKCFLRASQIEKQYDVAVIAYSWTSEGLLPNGQDQAGMDTSRPATDEDEDALAKVKTRDDLKEGWIARKARRYNQAKVNAQYSKDSLARLLRLVAAARLARLQQKVSFAAHSLGCHFLHYTINEQDAEASLSAMHNVILLAGCTGAAKHTAWVGQIHPLLKVYITYARPDAVLAAATVVDGDLKLGTAWGDERLSAPKYRYIDFENGKKMPVNAHRYFVAKPDKTLSKQATELFTRIFRSELDFDPATESPKVVYPVNCLADGSICYMGNAVAGTGGPD